MAASVPSLVDGILVLVVLEMVALLLYRRMTHRGMMYSETVSFLGAGAGLLLALRVLVSNGGFLWFSLAMLSSLLMHLWHVRQRWL